MNKKILWIYVIAFIILSIQVNAYLCYQESANTTNQTGKDNNCGLNYTGTITLGTGTYPASYYDGNWGSWGKLDFYYINYTKPINATGANWRLGWQGAPDVNVTIPSDCWNANATKLMFKILSSKNASCWNGTAYVPLQNMNLLLFYEEAVWWNFTYLLNVSVNNITNTSAKVNTYDLYLNNIKYSTTNGTVYTNIEPYYNYNVGVDAPGYAYYNTTFNTTASYSLENYSLYQNNFVEVKVYNFTIGTLITSNITLRITSPTSIKVYTFDYGRINLTELDTGINTFLFYNPNFANVTYELNIVNRSTNSLTAYMLSTAGTSNVTFTLYDVNGVKIKDMLMSEYANYNSTYFLVQSMYSDIIGKTYFSYDPTYSYYYTYNKSGYLSGSFILNPPRADNYDITVPFDTPTISYTVPNITGGVTYNNVTHIATFSYNSYDVNTTNYFYTISKIIDTDVTILCTNSSVLTSATFQCNLTGYSGLVYVQGVGDDYIFYGSYLDIGGTKLSDNVNQRDAALYSGFIMLIIMMGGVIFGAVGLAISGIVGILVIYWIGLLTPITFTLVIVDIVATIIIIVGLKKV